MGESGAILTSVSSVQSAVKKLLERDVITEINKVYSVTNRLFAMWINKMYGTDFELNRNRGVVIQISRWRPVSSLTEI